MGGPILPGEHRRPLSSVPLSGLVGRLGHHERQFRAIAAEVLRRLPPDDDLAASIRRALDQFEH